MKAPNALQPGDMAIRDSAKVDGTMGVCYTCLPCLDEWAKEIGYDVN